MTIDCPHCGEKHPVQDGAANGGVPGLYFVCPLRTEVHGGETYLTCFPVMVAEDSAEAVALDALGVPAVITCDKPAYTGRFRID